MALKKKTRTKTKKQSVLSKQQGPDIRAQAGENTSLEKVALENQQLREATKRLTADLGQKTRDLEVEAALERVRARAMDMRNSSELAETSAVLFHQIAELGIKAIRTGVGIFDDPNTAMELWLTTVSESKEVIRILDYVNLHIHPVFENIIPARKANQSYAVTVLKGNEVRQYYSTMSTYFSLPSQKKYNEEESFYSFFFSDGAINVITTQSLTAEECAIMVRLASVFGVIYTRFQDLEKAEAQALEARLESSLERIRSKALAMRQSNDLAGVVDALYSELSALDFGIHQILLSIYDIDNHVIEWWSHGYTEGHLPQRNLIPIIDHPFSNLLLEQWRSGADSWAYNLEGDVKRTWDEYLFTKTDLQHFPKEVKDVMRGLKSVWLSDAFMKHGSLQAAGPTPFPEEKIQVLKRFARVVDMAYTRMVDLQKAEAQTREAQIETALERVRSGMMAMHQSEGLPEVMKVIAEQLIHLGIRMDAVTFSPMDQEKDLMFWTATTEQTYPVQLVAPYIDHPVFNQIYEGKTKGSDFITISLTKAERDAWWNHFFTSTNGGALVPEHRKEYIRKTNGYTSSIAFRRSSTLNIVSYAGIPFSEEENTILRRFANVFDQSYTRFLDLQKAEAQAREAQIEAALERVRSRSMAMHKSEQLADVIGVISEQLQHLNVRFDNVSFATNNDSDDYDFWISVSGRPQPYRVRAPHRAPDIDNPMIDRVSEARRQGMKFYQDILTPQENKPWLAHLFANNTIDFLTTETKAYMLSSGFARSVAIMPNILLVLGNYASKPYSEEDNQIIKRFAAVFEQSYTRFLDLQKAEAQAREAQVEASLERIRSRMMAMHQSEDLPEVMKVITEQFTHLGFDIHAASFLPDITNTDLHCWISTPQKTFPVETFIPYFDNIIFNRIREAVDSKLDSLVLNVSEEDTRSWWNNFLTKSNVSHLSEKGRNIVLNMSIMSVSMAVMKYTLLSIWNYSGKPFSDEENAILKRFAKVAEQTYTRYLELRKAEAQALEAIKRASVDRVRAEIASMRSKEDLDRITPLIWRELTTLGVPFVRCGVFIMHEDQQLAQVFLSTPDGRAIATFHLPYHAANIAEAVNDWREKRIYKAHWGTAEFSSLADTLVEGGQIANREQYLNTLPKEGIFLNYLPFLQGMLYVGHTAALSDDDLNLVQSVADAFSTAYARYEDFNKLESAKALIENTLTDLKQTQTQLVQSEKMASLGELTAGIAHEIQNPLNFVNNFSEVSSELLDEMVVEVKKGNLKDIQTLVNDIKQNLDKIHFHGKRADGIVKSMLQHSRKSTNQKEPTDINALCDEYLRLSYHGLRAKDKSFNAKFETELDPNVGKLNVLPQEIGRVILNLINNAFYAVSEKKKLNLTNYEPTVTVATKKGEKNIEVRVRDNGIGIPQKVLDKIFNPFFTTKPTGQGTGLGLSLSYDIITKGHGGELKVETKEGEGSEFIVQLPIV